MYQMPTLSQKRRNLLLSGSTASKDVPAPKLESSFDLDDLLNMTDMKTASPEKNANGKRKGDIVDRRITPVFKKMKLTHPNDPGAKWKFPLPSSFEQLLAKFRALETAFCTICGRGRKSSPFNELATSVQSVCRRRFTKMDALRIEALGDYYRVRNLKGRKKDGKNDKVLGLVIMNPEKKKLSSILTRSSVQKRYNTFRQHLEDEVERQYKTWLDKTSRSDYGSIREKRSLHPDFLLNKNVLIENISTKPLPSSQSNCKKRKEYVKEIIRETRLDNKVVQEKLSQELTKYELLGANQSMRKKLGREAKKRLSEGTRERVTSEAHPDLKHLSPTLLVKIQGKQKIKQTLKNNPELALEKKRLEDAIYVSNLIRGVCISHRRVSLPLPELLKCVAAQHRRFPPQAEVLIIVKLLLEVCPEFCSIEQSITTEVFHYKQNCTLEQVRIKIQKRLDILTNKIQSCGKQFSSLKVNARASSA